MAEKLEFDLKVGQNELQKAISDATTGSKKLGDTVSVALGAFGGGLALKAVGALGTAISKSTGFILESVEASAEQEAALNKLSQALRQTGEFSASALDDFNGFASELQKASVFGDELVISQLAVAKSLGATNEQAKSLVQAAANLSAQLGGSLEQNVELLSKSLNGLVNKSLKAVIPELGSLSKEALSSGAAIDLINKKFAGSAQAELQTYSGSLVALKNSFGDLQEIVGDTITQSDFVKGVFSSVSDVINKTIESIQEYKAEQKLLSQGFVDTQSEVNSLSGQYADLTAEIEKQQAIINKQGPNKAIVSTAEIQFAETRVKSLTKEAEKLFELININQKAISLENEKAPTAPARQDTATVQEIEKLKELEAQKQAIIAESIANQQALDIEFSNQKNIRLGEDFLAQQQVEFDQAALRADAALQSELLVNQAKLKGKELGLADEIAFEKYKGKIEAANKQKEIADAKAQIAFQRVVQDQKNAIIGQGFAFASAVAKDGSKEQFLIQKAGALAQIAISRGQAIAAIPAQTAAIPYPANIPAAAQLVAYANIQAALGAGIVAASAIKGFAEGGIVGATRGKDNQVATVRTGEMVLNADQQKNLFDMINSGTMNKGNIVIEIDGREIAKVVRNQVRAGYSIA